MSTHGVTGGARPEGVPLKLADTYVGVQPAYLALATHYSTVPAARTLRQAGWAGTATDSATLLERGGIRVLLNGPGQPRHSDSLLVRGPGWQARFSSQTPDEVLADVAAAFVDHAEQSTPDRADIDGALHGLRDCGWDGRFDHRGPDTQTITAPGGLGEVVCGYDRGTNSVTWQVSIGTESESWEATLIDCPDSVTESVIGSLASTSPVRRRLRDLPVSLTHHLTLTPDASRAAAAAQRASPASHAADPGTPVRTSPTTNNPPARRTR